jgi:hypothetical protein
MSLRTRLGTAGALIVFVLTALSAPASALAPQPIDASEQGPLAFVAMTILCVLFVASLFYMDRVRERRSQREEARRPTE